MRLLRLNWVLSLALPLAVLVFAGSARAAQPAANPNWPCFSPLHRRIDAGLMWNGPSPPKGADWRADPAISALVSEILPRERDLTRAEAKLKGFVEGLPVAGRKATLTLVFAGLLAASNEERDRVIRRIENLTARQRGLSRMIAKVSDEAGAIPDHQTATQTTDKAKLVYRRDLLIHIFKSTEATMRYACNIPPGIEARLAHFAQIIERHMN